jgi:hypothetical protein
MNLQERIAPNFTLSSALNWMDRQRSMNSWDTETARRLVHEAYKDNDEIRQAILRKAQWMQANRNWINSKTFKLRLAQLKINISSNVEFGLICLSWYRPEAWERLRGRNGSSQHVNGHANDWLVVVVNGTCSNINAVNRLVYNELNETHQGGLAILENNGQISFIHSDLRPQRVRWTY